MKIAILLVAYGAANPVAKASLRFFEQNCRKRFGMIPLRWAYSSMLVRERIARQKQKSDSVAKALMRLFYERFTHVAIQPLQTIAGREYGEVGVQVQDVIKKTGLKIAIGLPLLAKPEDGDLLAENLLCHLPVERIKEEDVVFMGHGASHVSSKLYEDLGRALQMRDKRTYLGTISGPCSLEKILYNLNSATVWLLPLLSGIGSHALRDMAGDHEQSWRSIIEKRGHTCVPVLKGLCEYERINGIWLNNLQMAMLSLQHV